MGGATRYPKLAMLGLFALTGTVVRRRGFPVLTYHCVSDKANIISMPARLFGRELSLFKEKQYEVLSLSHLPKGLAEDETLPKRAVFLTFDDGLESFYWDVFPLLMEKGCRATVFLVTGFMGGKADWYPEESGGVVPPLPLLNWTQIREMHRHGIDFQAHTRTHPHLTDISLSAVAEEALGSKKTIEDALGSPVDWFCYPNGKYNSAIVSVIKDCGFKAAVTTDPGFYTPGDDPFQIRRLGHDRTRARDILEMRLIARLLLNGGYVPYVRFQRFLSSTGIVSAPFELKKQKG